MLIRKVAFIFFALVFTSYGAIAGGPDMMPVSEFEKNMDNVLEKKVIEPINDVVTHDKKDTNINEVLQPSDPRPDNNRKTVEIRYAERTEKRVNILFESDPPNAELVINGLYVGSTPVQVPLRDGVHNVKMSVSGFVGWERQIKAYKGLRVFATLEAEKVTKK